MTIYNMTNEEIIKEFSKEIDANFSPKCQLTQELIEHGYRRKNQ